MVCKPGDHQRYFSLQGTLLVVALTWLLVALLDIPNLTFLGFTGHVFNPYSLHCGFKMNSSWWFNTLVYTGVALLIPVVGVSFSYYRIWSTAEKSWAHF